MAHVGEIEMLGHTLAVHADAYGHWTLLLDDEIIGRGDSLDKAKNAARTALNKRKVKVSVPFWTIRNEHGNAYGLHARNRTVLAEIDGKKTELDPYHEVLVATTPDHTRTMLMSIDDKLRTLKRERAKIMHGHGLNLRQAVTEAITAAAEALE
jgi:hypothetical protein